MTSKTEIWKALPGVPGVEVSTFGRVKTLDRTVPNRNGMRLVKGHVLKPSDNGKGYLQVIIKVDSKRANKSVHRLVAQTFLSNPNNLPEINHKDCNRKNNNVDNLEFCTASYNSKYREKFGKAKGLPVFAVDLSTLEVSRFRSQHEASRKFGVSRTHINDVIKGKRNHTHGFWFTNADENADDAINRKLHEIGGVGLKIK